MAAEYLKIVHFESVDKETLLNYCEEAITQTGYKVVKENRLDGKWILSVPISWYSWGETISIELSNFSSLIEIEIRSRCKAIQVIDWGKNRRNVEQVLGFIKSRMKK